MPAPPIAWKAGLVAVLVALAFPAYCLAETGGDLTIKSARVGVGNRCKAGFWTPIWLTLEAGPGGAAGQVEIVIPDGDQVPVHYANRQAPQPHSVELEAGEEKSLLLYAKIGPIEAPITVQLVHGERVVWSQELTSLPSRLSATQHLVVSIGPSVGLADAVATIKGPAETSYIATDVQNPGDLPDHWLGYDGLDALVLTTSDARLLSELTSNQRQALVDWGRLGGRLIVCIGARGEEIIGQGTTSFPPIPGKFVEVSPLRDRTGLEAFTGSELPWDDEEFQRNRPRVTRLAEFDGAVLTDESAVSSGKPLIIRSAFGLGQLIFVGLDLDHPALTKWTGRSRLLTNLLPGAESRDQPETTVRRSVTHLGYEDLVGQLRAALDQFPGVTLVSFTAVATLTVIYLLLVGPGDFLFLRWLNLPRQVTWLTFAAVATLFGVVAWRLGADARGNQLQLNQAEIVDFDSRTGVIRGTTWTHLYSSHTATFDLAPQISGPGLPKADEQDAILSWQGLPGESLGGLGSRQVALASIEPYFAPPFAAIRHLPVQAGSSKSLSVRWWSFAGEKFDSHLSRDEFGQLAGELKNPLPIELTECLVAYEDRLYRLSEPLAPGRSVRMEDEDALNLEARLTERFVQNSKDISRQWDQASTDIPRIVRMLMFHESARGTSYTGLTHRYQPQLDLTDHLQSGRAVLVGRAAESVVRLTESGQPLPAPGQTWTWWRIVLPVQPSPSMPSQP